MEVADQGLATGAGASTGTDDVHQKIGSLTRQLHTALNELGFADPLRGSMGELPDAQSRLSYIPPLRGGAALMGRGRLDPARPPHDYIASETRRMVTSLVADPVAAVARGEIYNFLTDVERVTQEADGHLTEIMMAQDFHDLTGQVIVRVVNLASTIEQQLVQLLLQTAPAGSAPAPTTPVRSEALQGPVVDAESRTDVVTDQSQVDDLLASLGF